jgi:SPP1 gp7 family putative phage head morphogenesis protein
LAEYNQAVASSQMASKWVGIQKTKSTFKFLKYVTVGDENVRQSHADLDGIIKPVNDKFWDKFMPPNDWGCRCDIIKLRSAETTETNEDELPQLKDMFKNNVGKKGVIFPEHHPYFKVLKKDKKQADDTWGMKPTKRKDEDK